MKYQKEKILWRMAKNDMKSRYATSVLGFIWIFVLPFITIAVFWIVYQLGFRNQPVNNTPFILWFCSAYIPWLLFSDFLISGTNCLTEYSYLVKKVKFQVELLPGIKMITSVAVHVFFLAVLLLMFLLYKQPFTAHAIQILYYSLALTIYTYGWVLILSAGSVFFRDIIQIVNIVIQIGFWITPIIWNLREVNAQIQEILKYNPLCYIVEGYRDSLIYHKWFWEKPGETILFWSITILVLLLGILGFKRLRPFFADEL